jgi:hypothetical protein
MILNKEEWDALNGAVAIAEAALHLNKISLNDRQIGGLAKARQFLSEGRVYSEEPPKSYARRCSPKSYLPSRHPNRKN